MVFTEQLLYQIIFGRLHCYEVTLVKKCNKLLLQNSETGFRPKKIHKKLVASSERNNSGVSRINQIISKLLLLSKRVPSIFTFHKPLEAFYYN